MEQIQSNGNVDYSCSVGAMNNSKIVDDHICTWPDAAYALERVLDLVETGGFSDYIDNEFEQPVTFSPSDKVVFDNFPTSSKEILRQRASFGKSFTHSCWNAGCHWRHS